MATKRNYRWRVGERRTERGGGERCQSRTISGDKQSHGSFRGAGIRRGGDMAGDDWAEVRKIGSLMSLNGV